MRRKALFFSKLEMIVARSSDLFYVWAMPHFWIGLLACILSLAARAQVSFPSSENCDYYLHLEEQFRCGAKSYFVEAHGLCVKYLKAQNQTSREIQEFFPKVRYCLQNEIYQMGSRVTCENLEQVAIKSHVDCYLATGFCDLSWASRTELTLMTLRQFLNPIWIVTAQKILKACQQRD